MKQIFAHYETWEDFQNGMYQLNATDKHVKVFGAVNLLCDEEKFYNACQELLMKWTVAAAVNMTNLSQNRRAWLGAAASCFIHGTPEFLTRIAWNLLNKSDQDKANAVADKIIFEYENKITDKNAKTLFD